eukprot:1083849-Rhodomonas_salina.3
MEADPGGQRRPFPSGGMRRDASSNSFPPAAAHAKAQSCLHIWQYFMHKWLCYVHEWRHCVRKSRQTCEVHRGVHVLPPHKMPLGQHALYFSPGHRIVCA